MKTKIDFEKLAIVHSATCFLNSLLREWDDYKVCSSHAKKYDGKNIAEQIGNHIEIPLDFGRAILLPIKKYSILGRHQYVGNFYLSCARDEQNQFQNQFDSERNTALNHTISEISFQNMVELLLDFLSAHFKTATDQIEIFKKRVFSSLQNMRFALEFKANQIAKLEYSKANEMATFERCAFSFKDAEQALIIGHNFHPTPKSRDEFDESDLLQFSPEFGGLFGLDWFMADASIVHQKWASSFEQRKWTEELLQQDLQTSTAQNQTVLDLLNKGMIPIPMHPWQFKILSKTPNIAQYIQDGRMIYLGTSHGTWNATSSLRSIYRNQAPYMLKFSLSVKLTNSVRILLAREVARGLQLCDVLATQKGKQFLAEHPHFKIINEPAYLCLKDADGNPMDETIVMCRENPFNEESAHGKVMLATLAQDALFGGENLLQKLIQEMVCGRSLHDRAKIWFSTYLKIVVKPLLIAYANYGFILGAHQQNLILDIKDGLPVGAYFRDCQSVLFNEFGFSSFANEVKSLSRENGNVLNEKILSRFFSYHLILNSTFNVITALAACDAISEEELLVDLREFLEKIRANKVQDESCLNYLLDEMHLLHKGNFLCSFKSINETTTKDPFALYKPVQNSILIKNEGVFFNAA